MRVINKLIQFTFNFCFFLPLLLLLSSCGKVPDKLPMSFIRIEIPQSHERLHDAYQMIYASNEDPEKMEFDQKLRTDPIPVVTFIMINVSGPGMERLVWRWEACKSSNCSAASQIAPTYADLQVPAGGNNRRFQVIVGKETKGSSDSNTSTTASESQAGSKIYLYYGQADAILNSAVMNLSLTAAPIEVGGSDPSDVVGRYLTAANTGPTDMLDIYFLPPGDATPMLVDSSQMFNGWFKGITLNSISTRFSYRLRSSSQNILNFPADLTNALASSPSQNRIIKINNPPVSYYTWFNSSVGVSTQMYYSRGNNISTYYGFFGTGADSKAVCYTAGTALTVSYRTSNSYPEGLVINNTGTLLPLLWYSNKTGNYASHLYRDAGGVATSAGTCNGNASSDEYVNYVTYNHRQANGSSGAVIGVNPPYKIPALNGETWSNVPAGETINSNFFLYKAVTNGAAKDLVIKYAYLDGITNLGGTAFFYKPNATQADYQLLDNEGQNQTRCDLALSLGWSAVHQAYSGVTATVTISSAYPSSSNSSSPAFAICPYSVTTTASATSTVYYNADIRFNPYIDSNICGGITIGPRVDTTSDIVNMPYNKAYCQLTNQIAGESPVDNVTAWNTISFSTLQLDLTSDSFRDQTFIFRDYSVIPSKFYKVIYTFQKVSISLPSLYKIKVFEINNGIADTLIGTITPTFQAFTCYKISNLSDSTTDSSNFASPCPTGYQIHLGASPFVNLSGLSLSLDRGYYSKVLTNSSGVKGTADYTTAW